MDEFRIDPLVLPHNFSSLLFFVQKLYLLHKYIACSPDSILLFTQ